MSPPTARSKPIRRILRFRKVIRAPLGFVYRWCTDFREDDDHLTRSLYRYRARIPLREPDRIVRLIEVPGRNRNRSTDVEVIRLRPPDRWELEKMSWSEDETGRYRLRRLGSGRTQLDLRFEERWKRRRPPALARYRAFFDRVWDRYVALIEAEYRSTHPRGR